MFFWIFLLGIIALIVFSNSSGKHNKQQTDARLGQRNQEWVNFLVSYEQVAKTPAEKALIRRIMYDIAAQGLGQPPAYYYQQGPPVTSEDAVLQPAYPELDATQAQAQTPAQAAYYPESSATPYASYVPKEPSVQLDNTSLLLYFGAFLLVASVGLFTTFGGAEAHVRTLAILLVMAFMYGSGVWLFKNRPKLRQAGLAFSAVGIVIAPLVGTAAYNYIFGKMHIVPIWLVTSALCLVLYGHALKTFKQPLLGYLLVATFLSLFESGIRVVDTPVYYLGWGLAMSGIILVALNRLKGYWPELQEPSRVSSQIVVPLAVVAGVYMVPSQGALQLGISLLLAAAYYALEASMAVDNERRELALASHLLGLFSLTTITYGVTHRWLTTGIVLLVANLVQLLYLGMADRQKPINHQVAGVLMGSGAAVVALVYASPNAVVVGLAQLLVIGGFIWWRQQQGLAYGLASLAWLALPMAVGQYLIQPRLSGFNQALVELAALTLLLIAFSALRQRSEHIGDWYAWATVTYMLGTAVALGASLYASPLICLGFTAAVVLLQMILAEETNNAVWSEYVCLFVFVPIFRAFGAPVPLLYSLLGSLVLLIAMALRYRRESQRWVSTALWLVLPLAFSHAHIGGHDWSSAALAGSYLVVFYCLLLSRAIARGVLFTSSKIPLTSFARSSSLSYVFGYALAGFVAFSFSLDAPNTRSLTSVIVALLILSLIGLAQAIEKRAHSLLLLPFLVQLLLWSIVRPTVGEASLAGFVLSSSLIAMASYWLAIQSSGRAKSPYAAELIVNTSLISTFIAPASVIVTGHDIAAMPIGLFFAGATACYHVRNQSQSNRELVGSIITVSVMWLFGVLGVHQLQVYVYTIVSTLGFYAYARTQRQEYHEADSYIWWMLGISTVPLALQAMSGLAGGLYGWWFLLQQVVIMLLGMSLNKSFVTRWGLYASVAAVLYQLRGLGYAAVAVLAAFLIGLAIYQLNKHDDHKS